ncbi:MAG: NADH-quinone oxidoreductase subunit E [Acuticoccus sp.]
MAVRRLADEQPESFAFTPENLDWAKRKISDYPEGRQASAVIPILWKAQEQHDGWLPEPAIRLVADMLEMPYIRVFEVATFYTMFQLQPVGSVAHINVCGTTPCMLRGSEELIAICKRRIAAHPHELSADGRFSWEEVECAGACVNAPMVQINADTFEDLTADSFTKLLDTLATGGTPTPGPQSARKTSEPLSGPTSLTTPPEALRAAAPAPEADAESDASDTAVAATARNAGEDPATPEAKEENAASPDGEDRAEVETARSTPTDAPSGESAPVESAGDSAPADGTEDVDELTSSEAEASEEDAPDPLAVERADGAGARPAPLTRADVGEADNLQQISGIGPVLEKTLHRLGIFKFSQIAAWDQANKDWVGAYLSFKGRIDRERWVEQAQAIVGNQNDAS